MPWPLRRSLGQLRRLNEVPLGRIDNPSSARCRAAATGDRCVGWPRVVNEEFFTRGDVPDGREPEPVFLRLARLRLPIKDLAVRLAGMVHKTKRGRWFEEFAARKLHDVARVFGVIIEDLAMNLVEHEARRKPPSGEDTTSDVGFADANEASKPARAGRGSGQR